MDAITIERFRADTTIGIHDWEQQQRQPIILTLTLSYDCQPAADSDDIADALDYFTLTEHLKAYLAQSQCALIEHLAQQLIEEIFSRFPQVNAIDIHLQKPEAIENALVGVKLYRKR
jgi:dihydroneopterin aldolase